MGTRSHSVDQAFMAQASWKFGPPDSSNILKDKIKKLQKIFDKTTSKLIAELKPINSSGLDYTKVRILAFFTAICFVCNIH